jgi:hypothetical protein
VKFTPDDFRGFNTKELPCLSHSIARVAQAAFDKWLAEQEVVFKCTECAGEWVQDANTCGGDTHRARIVAIEEIKG